MWLNLFVIALYLCDCALSAYHTKWEHLSPFPQDVFQTLGEYRISSISVYKYMESIVETVGSADVGGHSGDRRDSWFVQPILGDDFT